ncbi:MAG: hypothetical protein DMF61_14570 [Blastocatellia bacterium AA13]|nr:MAG: hypothetical protein DMF61_14570 [Blastocatellia bacterium AA13]
MGSRLKRFIRLKSGQAFRWSLLILALLVSIECLLQYNESEYVRSVTLDVISKANATDDRARILALRAYLRGAVHYSGVSKENRPFLRATAGEILKSGEGYCGEVTRAFICMAGEAGIRSQRINLYGRTPHVVAEAELDSGERFIVDCQNPPEIEQLEPLDQVMPRLDYDDYSTLNVRRLHLSWLVSRVKLRMGDLTYWSENPHALKAALWFFLSLGLIALKMMRNLLRYVLHKRGWIHISDEPSINAAANALWRYRGRRIDEITLALRGDAMSDHGSNVVDIRRSKAVRLDDSMVDTLRCPGCEGGLVFGDDASGRDAEGSLSCMECGSEFDVINGIPRMLLPEMRDALAGKETRIDTRQIETAQSFGFEWTHFPDMYVEWNRNFLDYMKPLEPSFFQRKKVLDAGCGSGRHAFYAAQYGAEVWAVDIGPAAEVARRNAGGSDSVHVVQADLNNLPFAPESFDFIYSIGVLHHLPEPEAAFRNLLRYLKPGGEIKVYLYWKPEGQPLKRALLGLVTLARRVTTRLPYRLVYLFSFPAACAAFAIFVGPYRLLSKIAGLRRIADRIPMRQYSRYPFRVCVNDQFDRFSAPLERRYTRAEVESWLTRAGLEDAEVRPNCGWGGSGRKPEFMNEPLFVEG